MEVQLLNENFDLQGLPGWPGDAGPIGPDGQLVCTVNNVVLSHLISKSLFLN